MEAEVTVLPVPGGPWMSPRGLCSTVLMAYICELFSFGSLGAERLQRGGQEDAYHKVSVQTRVGTSCYTGDN